MLEGGAVMGRLLVWIGDILNNIKNIPHQVALLNCVRAGKVKTESSKQCVKIALGSTSNVWAATPLVQPVIEDGPS